MSNKKDYEEKIGIILAIPDEEVRPPHIPVDTFIQEAENTHYWAEKDKKELMRAGLSAEIIDDIPKRAGTCREAQSRWNQMYNHQADAEKEWKEKAPKAYDLHAILLHDFRFAYRNDKYLSSRISAIGEGYGHDDMFQDLNDMSVLGKANPEPLKAIGFDMSLLNEAARISDEMATLLTKVNGERASTSEAKLIRDKTYMYLKDAVDEIRAYGKYVFWRDAERLKRYSSEYIRKINQKRDKPEELESMEDAPEIE